MAYANHFKTNSTPQTEAIPGSAQVANSAGGFSWEVNDWTKLNRFLILGNEGGSYYASEHKMTVANAEAVLRCLKEDGPRVVAIIVEISEAGRAPKNDPAIFALALAAGKGDADTKRLALEALPRVCRIGTHLFQFIEAVQGFRGWGRGLRRAVGEWYTEKDADKLAFQLVKYRQRGGWTHRDALRLAKPAAGTRPDLAWAVGKPTTELVLPDIIAAFIEVEKAEDANAGCEDHREVPDAAVGSDSIAAPDIAQSLGRLAAQHGPDGDDPEPRTDDSQWTHQTDVTCIRSHLRSARRCGPAEASAHPPYRCARCAVYLQAGQRRQRIADLESE